MSQQTVGEQKRMAETIRMVIGRTERGAPSRREGAQRSPRMERALKRLICRYNRAMQRTITIDRSGDHV